MRISTVHVLGELTIAIGRYPGGGDGFDRAMVEVAESYAEQNDQDDQRLRDGVSTGRLEVAGE